VWASAGTVIDVTVDQRQATVQLGGAPSASCVVLTISTTPGLQGDNDVYIGCLYGDATGDGKTNVQDLLATKNRVSGYVNATTFRSDVDWDGKINVLDMTYIKNNLNQTVICP
jgi:hypothetical protein